MTEVQTVSYNAPAIISSGLIGAIGAGGLSYFGQKNTIENAPTIIDSYENILKTANKGGFKESFAKAMIDKIKEMVKNGKPLKKPIIISSLVGATVAAVITALITKKGK